MKNLWFLVGMIFLLLPWLLVGCGVAQEEHNAVVAQLSEARQELQNVQSELEATQANASELNSGLEKAEAELKATQDELEAAQAELEATKANASELNSGLEKAEVELEATQDELEAAQAENESFKSEAKRLWTLLDGNLTLNHAILGINSGLLLDDMDRVHTQCVAATGKLVDLEDLRKAELQAFWEEAYVTEGEQWNLYFAPLEKYMALNASRINIKAKALREHLTK